VDTWNMISKPFHLLNIEYFPVASAVTSRQK
jgi:hypothetical protein